MTITKDITVWILCLLLSLTTVASQIPNRPTTDLYDPLIMSKDGLEIKHTPICTKGNVGNLTMESLKNWNIYSAEELLCPEYVNRNNVCIETCVQLKRDFKLFEECFDELQMRKECYETFRQITCDSACQFGFWKVMANNRTTYTRICQEVSENYAGRCAGLKTNDVLKDPFSKTQCNFSLSSPNNFLYQIDHIIVRKAIVKNATTEAFGAQWKQYKVFFPYYFNGYHGKNFCYDPARRLQNSCNTISWVRTVLLFATLLFLIF